ncbi:zinc finger protein 84 [Aedes albopictus]|uniref:C2h2-type zn-finger protein n=1 Tax=Aedes albopictus TaxID=7160 RepID=A0ABM1XRU0_AEDAL
MDLPPKVPSICRTCLSRSSDTDKYRPLYKESLICSEKRRFVDLLLECIPSLKISQDDTLPRYICSKCSLSLKHFIRFRDRCLKTAKELWDHPERYRTVELEKSTHNSESSEESEPQAQEAECNNIASADPKDLPTNTESNLIEVVDKPNELFEIRSFDSPEGNGPNRRFECSYCHKQLGGRKSFKYHMQLHSDLANFLCNLCGECFKTKMAYLGHMASHDPDRYKCDVCGKSYRQAASLRNHKLNHSQEKPFSCTICGHSTTQKSGLKKHMLTHSESKSFVCDLCGDHFRFSSNLVMHKRRKHTVVKDHVCSECSKAFVSKDELLNHMMCHTDEKPFECDQCRKTFNRKSSLQFHQKNQHSLLPRHSCHVCGRGFGQKVSLQNHLRTHLLTD